MQHPPLVSVVMATYNGERFLTDQLDSILCQTYPNLELIIIDDGSTDGTLALLHRYATQNERIRVIQNETNLGYIRNFEKGMGLATGTFIALSDQDDIWHENKIQILLDEIGDSDVVFADSRLIDDQNRPIGTNFSDIRQLQTFTSGLSFVIGNTVSGHNMLIRRELIAQCLPFPTVLPHDHWLCFVATFRGPVRFIPQVLVDYRQHTENVFGITRDVNGVRRPRRRKTSTERNAEARERIQLLADKCPAGHQPEKRVLTRLAGAYRSFSLANNWVRMVTFFQYYQPLLATKKRTWLRKMAFCFKMFAKVK
jgi:glycosyltransferase involved in cell wall biosynthesis